MGFWQFVLDVVSLGGTYFLRKEKERYEKLYATYEHLQMKMRILQMSLDEVFADIREHVKASTRSLKLASKILCPLGATQSSLEDVGPDGKAQGLTVRSVYGLSLRSGDLVGVEAVAVGALSGSVTSLAMWGAVQTMASASTGAAMAGLHGAAAANAGWAWFGGGSLATGGGGMALGHLALPGIGVAIAVGVTAVSAYSDASKVSDACDELEVVNKKNEAALVTANQSLKDAGVLSERLQRERRVLDDILYVTKRKVRRWGWFSHIWRLLRYRFCGYYYSQEEYAHVSRLGLAVDAFLKQFGYHPHNF